MRFVLLFTTSILMLAGCAGDIKDSFGLRKSVPDEFNVVSNPPLYIPPEFNLVNPDSNEANFSKVYEEQRHDHKMKKDEAQFLNWLSEEKKETEIKKGINEEYAAKKAETKKKGVIRKTVAKLNDSDHDKYVDPVQERDRIKESLKNDKPINEGEVPVKTSSTLKQLLK